ncbi:MAG: cell division protein SepF [Acutalibacteraceae bacterium]
MKTNIFGELKDKFKKVTDTTAEEEYYDEDEEYDDAYDQQEYDDADESSSGSSYAATDEYDFGYSPSSSARSGASSRSNSRPASASSKYSRYGDTNIYKMNNDQAVSSVSKVSKVIYFNLEDAEDARDIADCMIKKDSVILADITKLSAEDAQKVLNFLDGVRYICKSTIEQISNINLIVPQSVELTGDFYGQMSQGTFLD